MPCSTAPILWYHLLFSSCGRSRFKAVNTQCKIPPPPPIPMPRRFLSNFKCLVQPPRLVWSVPPSGYVLSSSVLGWTFYFFFKVSFEKLPDTLLQCAMPLPMANNGFWSGKQFNVHLFLNKWDPSDLKAFIHGRRSTIDANGFIWFVKHSTIGNTGFQWLPTVSGKLKLKNCQEN